MERRRSRAACRGGAPVVYDDQLWLIAANRNSTFAPAFLVTADGQTWREGTAPWSPRGAPAVWVFDQKLFMAGGKYSVTENGTQRFIYRNDVWSMSPKQSTGSTRRSVNDGIEESSAVGYYHAGSRRYRQITSD